MRIPVIKPVCQLGLIADKASFNGWLEQRSGYCSAASLYDADDCSSEGEEPLNDQFLSSVKRSVKKENSSVSGKSLKPTGTGEKYHGRHRVPNKTGTGDGLDGIVDSAAHRKGQLVMTKPLRTKQNKDEVKGTGKEAEDVYSGSSQDSKMEAKAQDKHVKHTIGLEDGRAKKKLPIKVMDEEQTREIKPRRRKLVVDEDDDVEEGTSTTKAFQKRKAPSKYMELPSEEKQQDKRSIDGVHKGREKGTDNAKKVQFTGKNSLKNSTKNNKADGSISPKKSKVQSSGRPDPCDGTSSLAKYLGEGVKKASSLQKFQKGAGSWKRELKSSIVSSNEKSSGGRTKAFPSIEIAEKGTKSKDDASQAVKGICASMESLHSAVEHQRVVPEKDSDSGAAGEEVSSGVTEGGDTMKDQRTEGKGDEKSEVEPDITDVGWVLCDDCHKWRCIPAALADAIEATNRHWSCKENPNVKFADCSIPQEKSNAEINAELNISEVSICEEGDEKQLSIDSKAMEAFQNQSRPGTTWTLIKHNIFQHRLKKTLSIDEMMVCGCAPPEDGCVGCGENCLNRMLSIECTSQTCPCGDLCSNQQFQKRSYAKVGWFRCGRKGFGLQVLENVPKGTFIIEYVGEVLDMVTYEARQKEYAARGQKHFYFMTLNSNEVIDACVKGNLGRFINHSCDPNCTTEKWMIGGVSGEVCIGLFAIRDMRKGEEITFDYNFVRVCGAAAKKCLCGSANCRGFIGGSPLTPRAIVESDCDEDDPEPIMIEGNYEEDLTELKQVMDKKGRKSEVCPPSSPSAKRKWMFNEISEKQGVSSKRVKMFTTSRKLDSMNLKRLSIDTSAGRLDGVEEILNDMLDEKGGICKRQFTAKEAATQYLKLLLQTVASGDTTVNGEASRSIRDLSMVLDAMLKTVSRVILTEIVEKNGLQILHNMIKHSKRNYKTTPITRKLLKVLEFLAVKNILTKEQINAEPIRHGVESVRDTIFQLCRHPDSEVQQIAQRFREKWLPPSAHKPFKKQRDFPSSGYEYRNPRPFQKQFQHQDSKPHGEGIHKQHAQTQNAEVTRKPKKPSRWDQPSQEVLDTTQAGGLPPSFWPFNASNLLVGKGQSSADVPNLEPNNGATADELREKHPEPVTFPAAQFQQSAVAITSGPPTFSVFDSQHPPPGSAQQPPVPPVSQVPMFDSQQPPAAPQTLPAVVSGIPVGQFVPGSSVGYIPQQMSVCVGIPVTQFQGAHATVPDPTSFPQMHGSSSHGIHEGQPALAPRSTSVEAQELMRVEEALPPSQANERPEVTFGISTSQFFQQMHGVFGPAFHPWQLQILMAPHSWGPHIANDASHEDANSSMQSGRSAEWHENGARVLEEPDEGVGHEFEPEPPVPGLSPPHPQYRRLPGGRQYNGNERPTSSSMHSQQDNPSSWRAWKGNNGPRWSKFPIQRPKNFGGYRKDFGYTRKPVRQSFPGPRFSSRSSSDHREDAFTRRHPNDKLLVADSERKTFYEAEGYEEAPDCMPLEKPWGFGQDSSNFNKRS